MFETKCSKALMDYLQKTSPDRGEVYYLGKFQKSSPYSEAEVEATVSHLVSEGLLKQPFKNRSDIVSPTIYGLKYSEYRRWHKHHFLKYSILCPVAVTILTELVIHGSGWLLRLLLC